MCFPFDWCMTPLVGNYPLLVNVRHAYKIQKHKLTKIVEPFALFILFLNNKRELMQHLVARASQHVVEEVCGVGVAVGTFKTMLSVVLTTVSWCCTVGSMVGCWVVLIKLNSIKTKWCIYWDVIINNVQTACNAALTLVNKALPSPRPGFLLSL